MLDILITAFHFYIGYSAFTNSWTYFALYLILYRLIIFELPKQFDLHAIRAMDVVWLIDRKENPMNVQSGMVTERLTREQLDELAVKRGMGVSPRYEYYPVNIFGRYYWKKEKNYDPRSHIHSYGKPVTSKDQLQIIYDENFAKPFPKDACHWDILFIEEYMDNDSVIILRVHHSLADGISLSSLLFSLGDPSDQPASYVSIPRVSVYVQFLFYFASIFALPYYVFKSLTSQERYSALKQKDMSGEKTIIFGEPISVTKLKLMSKKYKTTLTTLTIALLGESIDQYFKENDTELDRINICVPFTLRGFTQDNQMLKQENQMTIFTLQVPLKFENFQQRVDTYTRLINSLKTSLEPWANMIIMWLVGGLLPNTIMRHVSHDVGKSFTLNFSSVPGPNNQIFFMGKQLKEMHPAGPTVGNTASVMAMLSFGGVMNISLTADKGVIKRPDELVKNIHRLVNEDSQHNFLNHM